MTLPISTHIRIPILNELSAVGGTDDVWFLYRRLIPYFPSLSDAEISAIKTDSNLIWRKLVQKAGKFLDEESLIRRNRGIWTITEKGKNLCEAENSGIIITQTPNKRLTHQNIQQMLKEIGEFLGYYAEIEFEYYDVIWRETIKNQRISHVFEVQSKGNLDSAFAKLKRAFDAQRSKPFLVLTSERDSNRAQNSLSKEFSELETALVIISFAQLSKIHQNLLEISQFLPKFR
jgi:hypothetical protein